MMKKILLWSLAVFLLILCVSGIYAWYMYGKVVALRNPDHSMLIRVYDWDKKKHQLWLGPKNPNYVRWESVSPNIKWAVIFSEDASFYSHHGVDYGALKEAFRRNLEVGKYVKGGSTITQQLAKNVFLSREKTITRKFRELIIAWLMEAVLTKTRILELYLNTVEFGPMVYGVSHASYFYFNKPPSDLNALEAAVLATLLPSPRRYDPLKKTERVEARAKNLLDLMYKRGVISEVEYEVLSNSTLAVGVERKIDIRMKQAALAIYSSSKSSGFQAISSQ